MQTMRLLTLTGHSTQGTGSAELSMLSHACVLNVFETRQLSRLTGQDILRV